MKTENEIKQKLKECEEKGTNARRMSHEFLEAYYGGLIDGLRWVMKSDLMPRAEICPVCFGTGRNFSPINLPTEICHSCEGKGWVVVLDIGD